MLDEIVALTGTRQSTFYNTKSSKKKIHSQNKNEDAKRVDVELAGEVS